MKLQYCDRCGKEIDISMWKIKVRANNTGTKFSYELCSECTLKLRHWVEDKPGPCETESEVEGMTEREYYQKHKKEIWVCTTCEHTPTECENCYPELGYKNDKMKRDAEAVKKFTSSDVFKNLFKAESEDRG